MNNITLPREKIHLKEVSKNIVEGLSRQLNISELMATILASRGLTNYEECEIFFNPDISHFHDPFLFTDMRKTVARISRAIKNKENIAVYGDYDVDGITSTSMLMRFLGKCGAKCSYYLPDRLDEGYGLSDEGVNRLKEKDVSLIITVDCGITAAAETELASRLGIDMIITDHHEPHSKLPAAYGIINPKTDSRYPERYLAGVGVALKLCHALAMDSGMGQNMWTEHLDLAALGTAADIVPLSGENRLIVKLGYPALSKSRKAGLKKLIFYQNIERGEINTRNIVFQLAPSINASGRLGDASKAVELLITENEEKADNYARILYETNMERRAIDFQVQKEAIMWVEENYIPARDSCIVAANRNWHPGVIGIAASKVKEKYYRPAFLLSINEEGTASGSGRSIEGINMIEALQECDDLLESYGGHAVAAGVTITEKNIPLFREKINSIINRQISIQEMMPRITADTVIDIRRITPKFFKNLLKMEPFGPGNPRPVFLARKLSNKYEPRIVGKNHIKMNVMSEGISLDAIAFNFGERFNELKNARNFSLAFVLDENRWNGRVNLQMKVKGIEI